jgi:hypothetical protein
MEGKKQKPKTMGWVERFGEIIFLHALPSPPQTISKPHNPINHFCFVFF